VFENRVLRREEVRGRWRRLRNEELHKMYVSSHIIRVIKPRTMIWAGHVAQTGKIRNA